jgi:hypothetical protein
MNIENEIEPVPGAARYFANIDSDNNKYAVWMVVTPDNDEIGKSYYTLSHHKNFEAARKAANKWQLRENKSVSKHHPELANNPITQR